MQSRRKETEMCIGSPSIVSGCGERERERERERDSGGINPGEQSGEQSRIFSFHRPANIWCCERNKQTKEETSRWLPRKSAHSLQGKAQSR